MPSLSPFRFRILTSDSVGAYTLVRATSQGEALAALTRQLCRWETAAPLHGPSRCPQWFD